MKFVDQKVTEVISTYNCVLIRIRDALRSLNELKRYLHSSINYKTD